jgi:glycerol-3-phosphate acyltransferase PlsY
VIPVLIVLLGYLLGSLPWSLWAGRLRGIDLRDHGSGNLGATNVYRVLGWKPGLVVLILDMAKGAAAVALGRVLAPADAQNLLPALAGLAAVAGHMFTPFASFRGGKGVATGAGVFLGLAPLAGLFCLGLFVAVLLLGGWVSLASGLAALGLPLAVYLTRDDLGVRYGSVLALAVVVSLLVIVRHRGNWVRLARGREQAIWEKRAERPGAGAAPEGTQP